VSGEPRDHDWLSSGVRPISGTSRSASSPRLSASAMSGYNLGLAASGYTVQQAPQGTALREHRLQLLEGPACASVRPGLWRETLSSSSIGFLLTASGAISIAPRSARLLATWLETAALRSNSAEDPTAPPGQGTRRVVAVPW